MNQHSGWVFIINPIAGNGFAGSFVTTVREKLAQHHITADIVFTEKKGHATELARQFVQKGVRHIMSVGGDGTFSEVVQSLVNVPDVIFGAIPAGTGNDFINILGFSDRFTDSDWDIFFQKNIIKMDVGRCNDRYFINGMGLGYDAQVACENYESQNSRHVKAGSKSKYWWHILKTLVTYKEKEMQITIDGSTKQARTFLNTIAIGRRLAGGFYLTPNAIANDGLLDVCLIQELPLAGRVKELLRVIKKVHIHDAVVNYFTIDKISFQFESEAPAHLDGELYFNSKFDIGILPRNLNVIFNPHSEHFFENQPRADSGKHDRN
ncbi:MAG: diacylglycerol/lipid kinase family protein [Candidatus Zhuqueibacterota bacterium]